MGALVRISSTTGKPDPAHPHPNEDVRRRPRLHHLDSRRSLGLERLENPMLIASEVDGKLMLEPATAIPVRAIPVRDIPKKTIRKWMDEDEAAMRVLKSKKK